MVHASLYQFIFTSILIFWHTIWYLAPFNLSNLFTPPLHQISPIHFLPISPLHQNIRTPSSSPLFPPSLGRMFSETSSETSSGSIWSSDEVGDALQEATAMATTAARDSDSDPNTTKVGEDTIMVNDSWTTRFSRSFKNYMKTGETAPGAVGTRNKNTPELEALQAVYNLRCKECTNCHYWMTCTTNKSVRCPGCHSTARTNVAPCYHLQVCESFTKDQSETYRTGLAYRIEFYTGQSKHPAYLE